MMTILENNFHCLRRFRPEFYDYLKSYFHSPIHQQPDNMDEDHLWSECHRLSTIKDARLVIVNGMVPASFIQKLKSTDDVNAREILVIEANPSIMISRFSEQDYTSAIEDHKIEFMAGLPQKMFVAFLKEYFLKDDRLAYRNNVGFFHFFPALSKDGSYYVAFSESVPLALSQLQSNLQAPAEDSYRGLMNLAENFDFLQNLASIDHLSGVGENVSAVIVSSGPSLNQHLPKLKQLKGKFIVGCSDSSLRILLQNEVQPDFVFCLERTPSIGQLFSDLSELDSTTLVTLPIVHPSVFRNYSGKILLMHRENAFSKLFWPEALTFNCGSSVATMAMRFFIHLKVSKIYLLGQDLAYDPISHNSHVKGTASETQDVERQRFLNGDVCQLPGNSGSSVISTVYWKIFLDSLNQMIQKFSVKCYNVIPEEMGAKLDHATRLEPSDFWNNIVVYENSQLPREIIKVEEGRRQHSDSLKAQSSQIGMGLADLKSHVLEYADSISQCLLDYYPEADTPECHVYYEKKRRDWRKFENKIREQWCFNQLIKVLFRGVHIQLMTEREKYFLEASSYCSDIVKYCESTHEWLKNVLFWCLRVERLLKR